jgi:hemoglobin-like flavoprotein
MAELTPDQVKLVQSNWAEVKKIKDVAADLFYNKLFELDPTVRDLFREDISIQKKALMATISFAVATLNHPDKLVPAVQKLGERHGALDVTPAHYTTVGQALLWTLEQGLGEAWTPEAETAWTGVYGVLSSLMIEASDQAAA